MREVEGLRCRESSCSTKKFIENTRDSAEQVLANPALLFLVRFSDPGAWLKTFKRREVIATG